MRREDEIGAAKGIMAVGSLIRGWGALNNVGC
jgi:hypothetical protein